MKATLFKTTAAVAMIGLAAPAVAEDKSGEKFRAELTGDAQVPDPVETDTRGDFRLAYDDFDNMATYRIRLNDGNRVFMAHIHCAAEGQNGPIAVWLAGAPPSPLGWEVNGKWIDNATFTDADVVGTDCGNSLQELMQAMREGRTYVNVHTRQNPGGEVRGQIRPQRKYKHW